MAVQTTFKKLNDHQNYIYERYSGNVLTSDIIKSLIQSVVKTATDQVQFILSNWEDAINAEFSEEDITSAVEGAFSVDLVDRHMFIAFILNNNPHFEYLAEVFQKSVDEERVHINVFRHEDDAMNWLYTENEKLPQ